MGQEDSYQSNYDIDELTYLQQENACLKAENEQLKKDNKCMRCDYYRSEMNRLKSERQAFTDWLLQENSKVVNFEVSKFILSCANQLRKGGRGGD